MNFLRHVAIKNFAGPHLDTELALCVEALRSETPRFCAAWGLPPFGVAYYGASQELRPGVESAVICVVKSTGDTEAFARHSQLGASVFGYVDETTCRAGGEPIPRALSHEYWEMGADPGLDQVEPQPDGTSVLREVVDPLNRVSFNAEATFFGRTGIVPLSAYVLPAWYRGGPGPYDRVGMFSRPLETAATGYYQVVRGGVMVSSGAAMRISSFGRTARRIARALPAMP